MAPSPRLTRVEQQAALRQRILDAALGVFRSTGFANATIQQIAELAGCTRGSVYLHFRSKEALLVAVYEEHIDAQVLSFRSLVAECTTSDALIALLLSAGRTSENVRPVTMSDSAAMIDALHAGQHDLLPRVQTLQVAIDQEYGAIVEKLAALRGQSLPLPANELAPLVMALRQGCIERSWMHPDYDLTAGFTTALNLLLSGSPTTAIDLSAAPARKATR